jgi:hypothetical protein
LYLNVEDDAASSSSSSSSNIPMFPHVLSEGCFSLLQVLPLFRQSCSVIYSPYYRFAYRPFRVKIAPRSRSTSSLMYRSTALYQFRALSRL